MTTADRDGRRTYRRSVVLLLQRAIYDVYGSMTQLHVMHSLGEGYYCQLEKAVECADSQQENIMKIQTYKAAEKTVRKA